MTILNIEGQDKYSAGDGIQISPNKVISLLLQASPNLLKINGDGELYCDLQTVTNPSVNTVFDVGITTGYVEPSGGWPEAGQILMCKTTTGVHFCILKGDDDKLYYTSDPRDSTSWSHILRDDDLDALMDTLKDYIDEQFEHLEGYVKITSCKGVRESNHYMVKNIYTDADQNGVTLSLYRRDLKGELPNDLISEITFPVADEYHAGIITAEVYNQIQSNTARILALEGVGGYIGVYPTIAERPTNVSQLPAEVIDPKPKDYVKIASDTNFRGQSSIYTITAINSTTGAITWDGGYASVSTLNYRIYDTIADRNAELNVYDGLACFVVATGKKYTYTTNDGWTADVCDYDDLTDRPIVNITGSLDNVLGEDNKTTVYNNGDGTRIVVSRAGQTSTQVIERKDGYSTRTTTDEGQTRSAWTNVEFESGIKWDKVIISATEPVDKVVTTPWLDTRDESLNVWSGVRWIKIPNTIQKSQLPTASQSLLNVIYQYVGSTNANYTNGYFYKCVVDDPEADPVTYKWSPIKTQSDEKVLNDLDDVVVENPQQGDGIIYDEEMEKFMNKPVLTHRMKGYRSYGNCCTNNPTTSTRANSRKTLHTAIHLPAGVVITAKTGYQFGIYRNTEGQETGEYFNIGNGWVTSYTTLAENDYYFVFMYVPGGIESKINIDATIEDMLDMEDYSPFYEDVLETPSPWKGKTVAFIGDSITAGSGTTIGQRYCDYLADWMGVRRKYVDGIGGSCYSKTSDYGTNPTPLSMRFQNTPISDLIVVFMGTNDYGHGTPIGYFEDFDGTHDISFYSACRMSLSALQARNGGRLVVMTPLHRKQLKVDGQITYPTDDTPNAQGNTLQDYVDALKDVCRQYSIPVIDLYAMSSFTPRSQIQYEEYTTDGLHPNEGGHYMLAREILPILNNFAFGPNDNQKTMQRKVLPTASAIQLGKIIQYTGATTSTLTNGFFYKCVSDGAVTPTYSRENIDVQIAKTTLVDLEDTTITSPTNGQVLTYNSTSQKWENTTFQGGAIQYNTNSPYKPGYFRVGTQAQYDALSQYYTEQENDTVYFCI